MKLLENIGTVTFAINAQYLAQRENATGNVNMKTGDRLTFEDDVYAAGLLDKYPKHFRELDVDSGLEKGKFVESKTDDELAAKKHKAQQKERQEKAQAEAKEKREKRNSDTGPRPHKSSDVPDWKKGK